MDAQTQLQQWITNSKSIVFFGGAGVSTESGIPDFRSVDGLYHQSYDYPPETILSHSFFMARPEEFYRFYRAKMLCRGVQPNAAHRKLAQLEAAGRLRAVVTQNIDGLHQMAGSRTVYELHGTQGVPRCPACGGIVKPDVVLYEEALDEATVDGAVAAIRAADLLIVGGTSLTVYPAAGLLRYYRGGHLVLINRDATPYDSQADLVLRAPIGTVLGEVRV